MSQSAPRLYFLGPHWSNFHNLEYSKSEQDPVGQNERMLVVQRMLSD